VNRTNASTDTNQKGTISMASTDNDIFDRVTDIIAEITDIKKEELQPGKSLTEDLEIDSLTKIELAVTIQDEFDIEVEDEKLKELKTVQDIVDLVKSAGVTAAS
jgi:acyl carrier protein